MKTNKRQPRAEMMKETKADDKPPAGVGQQEAPPEEAFLEQAKQEPRRKLLLDHVKTIHTLRDEKAFTFREIAEWFNERGFATDRSAVYRAYLLSIPKENLDPEDDELKAMEPD